MSEISRLLAAGNQEASFQLLPLVYEELRKLAATFMANEKPGQSLDATALVHEAYLRLAKLALLTIDGNSAGSNGILQIRDAGTVTISGMTHTRGQASAGGGPSTCCGKPYGGNPSHRIIVKNGVPVRFRAVGCLSLLPPSERGGDARS